MIYQSIDLYLRGFIKGEFALVSFWKCMLMKLVICLFYRCWDRSGSLQLIISIQILVRCDLCIKSLSRCIFCFAYSQSITVKILPPEALPFFLTAVYASNEVEDLRELWTSLKDTTIAFDLSTHLWMVCGDFNEILDPQESSNPCIITSTRPMRELGQCLSDIGLFDLASQGPRFTYIYTYLNIRSWFEFGGALVCGLKVQPLCCCTIFFHFHGLKNNCDLLPLFSFHTLIFVLNLVCCFVPLCKLCFL